MAVEWYYWLLGIAGALGIALIFEESRDWLKEAFESIITFEWLGSLWELISGAFEGLGEFSMYGLTFGCVGIVFLFAVSKWTLAPFLVYYSPTGKIVWTIITYAGTFVATYLMGKAFENSS